MNNCKGCGRYVCPGEQQDYSSPTGSGEMALKPAPPSQLPEIDGIDGFDTGGGIVLTSMSIAHVHSLGLRKRRIVSVGPICKVSQMTYLRTCSFSV